jgi:hypothetical protein
MESMVIVVDYCMPMEGHLESGIQPIRIRNADKRKPKGWTLALSIAHVGDKKVASPIHQAAG